MQSHMLLIHIETVGSNASLSLQYYCNTHYSNEYSLQPWMLTEQDGDISNKWNVSNHTSNYILPDQVILTSSIKFSVICDIVVPFS